MAEPAREPQDRKQDAPDAAAASVWEAAVGAPATDAPATSAPEPAPAPAPDAKTVGEPGDESADGESGTGWPGAGPHDAHGTIHAEAPLARRPGQPDPNIRDAGSAGPGRPADWRPAQRTSGTGRPAARTSRRDEGARDGSARDGSGQGDDRRPEQFSTELLSGVQRWLIKSSAKTMRREIEGQVRKTLTGSREQRSSDAWGTATTEPPPGVGEAPECTWCPICQAARRMREPGPGGRGSRFSGVSEAVSAAVQDAVGVLDGVLSRSAASHGDRSADRAAGHRPAGSASKQAEAERAADEPGDRS
ncbi:MAG TPA: hypothetical protein VGG25_09910 [Streptosporangiaceae bacterium]